MYNYNTKVNRQDFNEAVDYVHWLDVTMNNRESTLGQLPLHYCFNNEIYDCITYYSVADSREIFFYTPHSYDFVGVSHTLDDTYTFLRRLIYDEFGWVDYAND